MDVNKNKDECLIDAYESLLYHELMNNLNFISLPDDLVPTKEIFNLTKFSGIQIFNFLQTLRIIKNFEKNELTQIYGVMPSDASIHAEAKKLSPLSFTRNQKLKVNLIDKGHIIADIGLMEVFWFNMLMLAYKFAKDNSEIQIDIQTTESDKVEYKISFDMGAYLEFPNDIKLTSFADVLLKNAGFEQVLALKVLFFNLILQAHDSNFNIEVKEKSACFSFSFNKSVEQSEVTESANSEYNIPVVDPSDKTMLFEILNEIKNTPQYKLSALHKLIDSISVIQNKNTANNIIKTLKTLLDNGNCEGLYLYIQDIIDTNQS
ncbi:MAG: hypothetical protein GX879_01990 [Bacteroidales bacterium]|nr:hypothetical protein [Bacteroidales bacterium]